MNKLSGSGPHEFPHEAAREERLPEFNLKAHRDAGSMWTWSMAESPFTFSCTQGEIRGLSCYQFESSESSSVHQLQEDDIPNWLNEEVPKRENRMPYAGYKVLQVMDTRSSSFNIPMKSQTFEAILRAMDIPATAFHVPTYFQGGCGMFLRQDGTILLVRRQPYESGPFGWVLVYNPRTNFTTGYVFSTLALSQADYFYDKMHHQFLNCPHPLVIPLLFSEIDLDLIIDRITQLDVQLEDIEVATGFYSSPIDKVPITRDYQALVRDLGLTHGYYLRFYARLKSIRLTVASLLENFARLNPIMPDETKNMLAPHAVRLRDRMEYTLSSVEHGLVWRSIADRLQVQQSVLFNLVAQADNNINICLAKDSREIAAASKRDSSAMKIIAVLTTLFLPATFVATFLAMPLFDWQAPTIRKAATSHYWLYWAVTVPLTLVTMVIILAWVIWRGRKDRVLDLRARNSPFDEEKGGSDTSPSAISEDDGARRIDPEVASFVGSGSDLHEARDRIRTSYGKGHALRDRIARIDLARMNGVGKYLSKKDN